MISTKPALRVGLCVLLALLLAASAIAIDPVDIVQKSETAERYVSYRALKYADISVGKSTIRAQFKVLHKKPDKTKIFYFAPSELNGIMTIDRGSDSWRFLPAQKQWQHNKWDLSYKRLNLTLRNYRAINKGREQIAGRQAYVIEMQPTKRGNPSETLWIDTQHYVVLKSVLRNSSGEAISTSAFKEITFEPKDLPDSTFDVPNNVKPPNNPVPDLGFKVVKPKYMPKGYTFVQMSTVPLERDVYAAHLMYTNGINTISIFERKKSKKKTADFSDNLGRWATVIRFDRGHITFTIIGDIAKKELQKIGDSLK